MGQASERIRECLEFVSRHSDLRSHWNDYVSEWRAYLNMCQRPPDINGGGLLGDMVQKAIEHYWWQFATNHHHGGHCLSRPTFDEMKTYLEG